MINLVEMMIDNNNIAEYGARLLSFSIGGTELTTATSASYNANFPKLFHTDYGQRVISTVLVFKPQTQQNGMLAKMHAAALQKSRLDNLLFGNVVDISLPDGYFYRCVLNSISNESFDGDCLEVTYSFTGTRHLSLATIKGSELHCSSTVDTDCRITATITGCNDNTRLQFIMSYGSNSVSYSMNKVNSGDVVVFDGINCKVTKNGLNAFGDSNVVEFPKLHPGKNIYIAQHSSPVKVEFVTEYYPTFI